MTGNKVLIVVDQTPDANIVLREGFEFCHKLRATPTILTTMKGLVPADSSDEAKVIQRLQAQAQQAIGELQDRVGQVFVTSDEIVILTPTGDAAQEIRRAASSIHADLIIIGNHPESGLGLFLGSTANVVLHDTPCHVLAINLGNN